MVKIFNITKESSRHLVLNSTQTHYKIALSDLYNSLGQTNFNGNDVVAVVFTKNGDNSSYQNFNINISNLHFSGNTAGIELENIVNKEIKLTVYPNPATELTNISFNLPETSKLKISLFNEAGKLISVIRNESLISGDYYFNYDCNALNSGIYILKFETEKYQLHQKMIVMH